MIEYLKKLLTVKYRIVEVTIGNNLDSTTYDRYLLQQHIIFSWWVTLRRYSRKDTALQEIRDRTFKTRVISEKILPEE